MEATQIIDAMFKIMVIRMLKDLRGKIDDLSETLNREIVGIKKNIETINKNQSQMKITTPEIKNLLEGINSGLDKAVDQTTELEDKKTVSNQGKNEKEKRLKRNEESLRDPLDNIKHNNICII